jgi:hypothetical protein
MDEELKKYLDAKFAELDAKIETRFETAIHQSASPAELRARTRAAVIRMMDIDRMLGERA